MLKGPCMSKRFKYFFTSLIAGLLLIPPASFATPPAVLSKSQVIKMKSGNAAGTVEHFRVVVP